jgi:hypothetical protein
VRGAWQSGRLCCAVPCWNTCVMSRGEPRGNVPFRRTGKLSSLLHSLYPQVSLTLYLLLWLSCGSAVAHFTCQHTHNLVRGTASQPVNRIEQILGGFCSVCCELSGGMLRYLWFDVVAMPASCKDCSDRQPIFSCKPKSVPSTYVRTQLANGRTQASLSVPNASGSAVGTDGKKKL